MHRNAKNRGFREDDDESPSKRTWGRLLKTFLTMVFCFYVAYLFDVHTVMLYSKRVVQTALYLAYGLWAVFVGIGVYLTWIVGSYNSNWEDTHYAFIKAASLSVVLGMVCWTIAVWPVFHIWTLPLGFVILVGLLSALAFLPAKKEKTKK